MDITFTTIDRILVAHLNGDIDHHTAEMLRFRIEKEHKRRCTQDILFDFSDVSFMDSSGIGMILGRYKKITAEGGRIILCNVSESINRIFSMSGVYKLIKCYNSVEEAVNN